MSTTGRKRQNNCPDGFRVAKLPKLDVSNVDWPAFFKDAANQTSVHKFSDEPRNSKKYYALRVATVRDRELERRIELKAISSEVVAGQKRHLPIYVYFDAACLASLRERDITIHPQDEIYLSLKDARRGTSEPDDIPVLHYQTNVIYQYTSCADQRLCGKVVNTADWFNKFASSQSLESDDMDVDEVADNMTKTAPPAPSHEESWSARTSTRSKTTASMPTPPTSVYGSSPVNAPSVPRVEPELEPIAIEQPAPALLRDSEQGTAKSKAKSKQKKSKPKPAPPAEQPHDGVEKLSKGQRKKRNKREKKAAAAESGNQESASATVEQSPKPVTAATPTIPPVQPVSATPATPTPAAPATPTTWPPPGGQIIQLTAPGEEEGSTVLTTGRGERYIALNTVASKPVGEIWSVIGIVEFAKDVKRTKMGDWNSYVRIFDPSVVDQGSRLPSSVCIMGFSKLHREWAPEPKQGQVIILRNIKRTNGHQNIGYGDHLQWAIYDPDTRSMTHGAISDEVAQRATLEGGFVSFSPFWHADEEEAQYCAYLHQWWQEKKQEMQQEDQAGLASGSIIQVGTPGSNPIQRQYYTGRPLLRIADLSFERCNSQRYFDCTVEIVAVFADRHPPDVYVTDYSSNGHLRTPTGAWVPERFDKLCFKIEMWDASTAAAGNLLPGDYYTISNCRLRDNLGYYEGHQQEVKFRKLNEADAESDPMLKELLERKREWETTKNAAPPPAPEIRAIGEVALDCFFDTVVEVLHVEGADLYVTDYSAHPDLQDLRYDPAWAAGLDGLVLKIRAEQVQEKVAQGLSRGNFCRITNLRVVHSAVKGETIGKVGGNERKRIFRVNPALGEDRGFKELLERKERWEEDHTRRPDGAHSTRSPAQGETPTKEGKRPVGTFFGPRKSSTSSSIPPAKADGAVGLTFAELRGKPKSKIYTVVARATLAVDRKSWDDCIVRMCAQCQREIPRIRRACLDCNDTDHEFVQVSDARVLLEFTDTTGDTERVAVMSKVRPPLHTEVKASSEPERVFEEWLKPLTGDDLSKVERTNTPLADVVLLSKENETYCLVDYKLRRS